MDNKEDDAENKKYIDHLLHPGVRDILFGYCDDATFACLLFAIKTTHEWHQKLEKSISTEDLKQVIHERINVALRKKLSSRYAIPREYFMPILASTKYEKPPQMCFLSITFREREKKNSIDKEWIHSILDCYWDAQEREPVSMSKTITNQRITQQKKKKYFAYLYDYHTKKPLFGDKYHDLYQFQWFYVMNKAQKVAMDKVRIKQTRMKPSVENETKEEKEQELKCGFSDNQTDLKTDKMQKLFNVPLINLITKQWFAFERFQKWEEENDVSKYKVEQMIGAELDTAHFASKNTENAVFLVWCNMRVETTNKTNYMV